MITIKDTKIKNIKDAAAMTANDGLYYRIYLDLSDGQLMIHNYASDASWSEYHDPDIIQVWYGARHVTVAELKATIASAIDCHDRDKEQADAIRADYADYGQGVYGW